jgi:hypothetical protein
MIVSIPIDLSDDKDLQKLEEKGVRGRYVSVERILELENGETEWRMATSSTPGGSIPSFIVESTMAGKIAQVIPLSSKLCCLGTHIGTHIYRTFRTS